MRAVRLKPRRGVGIRLLIVIEPKPVSRSRLRAVDESRKISAILGLQRVVDAIDNDADLAMRGCPDAEVDAATGDFGANRPAPASERVRQNINEGCKVR